MSMDAADPSSFHHRTERLSTGRTYHFVDQLPAAYDPKSTPTLLCVHGFPDLWYGWRNQIKPWVLRGYRVVVPDMLGYGGTDKPADAAAYTTKRLSADLAALLDLIGVMKAVLIGHDWGSYTVGRFALWHPDRILALIQLSVPYTPPARIYISPEEAARRYPDLAYQIYFADPASTKEIEGNLSLVWQNMYRAPKSGYSFTKHGQARELALNNTSSAAPNTLLTTKEAQYYLSQFESSMNGPLNYYRTGMLRFEEEQGLSSSLSPSLPALIMWGTRDPTCVAANVSRARKFIPSLEDVAFDACGHWLMVEAKDAVTDNIIHFLKRSKLDPGVWIAPSAKL